MKTKVYQNIMSCVFAGLLALLVGIPLYSGFSWSTLLRTDLTQWLLIVLALLIVTGTIRTALRFFVLQQRAVNTSSMRPPAPSPGLT